MIHLGRTNHAISTVSTILAYMAFRMVPLYPNTVISALWDAHVSDGTDLNQLAAVIGHSFRIGAATAAACVRMEDSLN